MKDPVFVRYWLLQLPGWLVVAVLTTAITMWLDLAVWVPFAALGAWVLKDLALYPLLKTAYDPTGRTSATRRMVGSAGTAEQDVAPVGFVRVRGELWRAEIDPDAAPVRRGERVRVIDADGMTLRVIRSTDDG